MGIETLQQPALRLEQISKSFPGVKALSDVSFDVQRGEIRALVGENGAGKSTLMKVLSGAYTADSGRIEVFGETVAHPTPSSMISRGIAVIYQELAQAPHLTVAENIFMGRLPKAGSSHRLGHSAQTVARDDGALGLRH